MLKRILSLCVVTFLIVPLFAMVHAQGIVEGEVVDAETGEPLPGATVQLPVMEIGTTAEADGSFTLPDVAAGQHQLTVNFVGYIEFSTQVEVDDGETQTIQIELRPDVLGLDELVVTGLGIRRERERTQTSVGRVDAEELTVTSDFDNVSQLISGNVAGVYASPSSGNIGSGIRFNVRGGGGIGGDGQPVIYIDGVRVDNNEVTGFGAGGQGTSPLADLNPRDIANIDVIRGPAGAAIYGTEGANGVVLIETKSGNFSEEASLNVEYRGTFGFQSQGREYDEDLILTGSDANAIFKDGPIRGHTVSASGGAENYRYFASVENRQEEGILPRTRGDRTNLRANFEVFPTEDVNIRVNTSYTINEMERPDNDNNVQGYLGNTLLLPQSYLFTDSLAINEMEDIQRVGRFVSSARVSWSPFDGFNISGTVGYDGSTRNQERTRPAGFVYSGLDEAQGDRNLYNRVNNQYNFDAQAQYSYNLTDELEATSLIGSQFTDVTRRINWGTAEGFPTDLIVGAGVAEDIVTFSESLFNTRTGGIFAQQEFVYDNTYTLSGMIRRDVASALGEGVTDVWYPGISLSAELSNLSGFPDNFQQFMPRLSYGETGELPDFDDGIPLQFGGLAAATGSGAVLEAVGNPDIVPERVSELEAGVDIRFLDNYTLDLTYWYNRAENSIIAAPLASSTGFAWDDLPQNVGSIESQGVEATLGITPVVTESARLDLNMTYSYQTSEVLDLGPEVENIFGGFNLNVLREGLPRQAFYTQKVEGPVFDDEGRAVFDGAGNQVLDVTERQEVGQPVPNHTGGLRVNLTLFRNLSLNAFAEYALGHQVYNNTRNFTAQETIPGFGFNHTQRIEANETLQEAEPGTVEYINAAETLAFTDPRYDDNFVEDADWLKLRELSVNYDFTDLFIQSGMSQVNTFMIGLSARNIYTLTEYSGPDPEVNFDGGRGLIRGQDFLTLQTPQTFTLNVTVGF